MATCSEIARRERNLRATYYLPVKIKPERKDLPAGWLGCDTRRRAFRNKGWNRQTPTDTSLPNPAREIKRVAGLVLLRCYDFVYIFGPMRRRWKCHFLLLF